jgi:hypothetical protein
MSFSISKLTNINIELEEDELFIYNNLKIKI